MPLLRKIPLKLRLPITHAGIEMMARRRARRWTIAADHRPARGPLVVSAFLSESSGIGQGGRLTIAALERSGLRPIHHDIGGCYRQSIRGDGRFPADMPGGVWLIHANAQECLIALMAFPVERWRERYRIAYWAWETSRAPPLWSWAARYFHEIWVPSRFVADALAAAFAAAGDDALATRIRIMPHPLEDMSGVHADRPGFGLDEAGFEMLCLFDTRSTPTRKNPWAVLTAWTKAFPHPRPGVHLRLKVQRLEEDAAAKARLEAILAERPDIRLIDRRMDGAEILRFIASFDALISLHRSEGFGLTLAEAMALGVSVIATGWSGNLDFMDAGNSYPVPVTLVPVRDPSGLYGRSFGRADPGQRWAEPDIGAAADLLRAVIADPGRGARIERARASVRELSAPWSPAALARLPFAGWLDSPSALQATA